MNEEKITQFREELTERISQTFEEIEPEIAETIACDFMEKYYFQRKEIKPKIKFRKRITNLASKIWDSNGTVRFFISVGGVFLALFIVAKVVQSVILFTGIRNPEHTAVPAIEIEKPTLPNMDIPKTRRNVEIIGSAYIDSNKSLIGDCIPNSKVCFPKEIAIKAREYIADIKRLEDNGEEYYEAKDNSGRSWIFMRDNNITKVKVEREIK